MKYLGCAWTDPSEIPKKLQKEIDDILDIDISELQTSLVEIMHHESKIIQLIYTLGIGTIMAENELLDIKKERFEYYSFKSNRTLSATQVKMALETDKKVKASNTQLKLVQAKLSFFEKVLAQIKSKNQNIKSMMSWEQYISGNR